MTNPMMEVIYRSPSYTRVTGYSKEEIEGRPLLDIIHPDDHLRIHQTITEGIAQKSSGEVDFRLLRKDGQYIWMHSIGNPLFSETGEFEGLFLVSQDITKQKEADTIVSELENQLRQSQKMEAVGRLAGGMAHDFNNLLTAIMGAASLRSGKLSHADPIKTDLDIIIDASKKAAALIAQLLAFSRQQILRPEKLDIRGVLSGIVPILRRLLREDVAIEVNNADEVCGVAIDRSQMEQVLLNLAANSGDAMPSGGKLRIQTSRLVLDEEFCKKNEGITPGPYIRIAISDTGVGIDAEIIPHVFEPFYTTKMSGQGTGLGLSTVYGIVRQSGGTITISSKVSYGTTFYIYLPSIQLGDDDLDVDAGNNNQESVKYRGTIVLVEDEDLVRVISGRILMDAGYHVIHAANAKDALALIHAHNEDVDLLLSDVVLPAMNGNELARQVISDFPQIRVLLMSGYSGDSMGDKGLKNDEFSFINKPFMPEELIAKVAALLK